MMKTIFRFRSLLLAAPLFLLSCSDKCTGNGTNSTNYGDFEEDALYVRKMKSYKKTADDQVLDEISYKYDALGRLVGYKRYVSGVFVVEKKNFVYDGNKVAYETIYPQAIGSGVEIDLIKEEYMVVEGIYEGKQTAYESRTPDGKLSAMYTYQYDSQGRMIDYRTLEDAVETLKHSDFAYAGNTVTYTYTSSTPGSSPLAIEAEYTKVDGLLQSKCKRSKFTYSHGLVYEEIYTFDSKGRGAGIKCYENGTLTGEYKNYVYQGNRVTYEKHDSKGLVIAKYEIEYLSM